MKQIDHPNIIRIIDVYEDDKHLIIVMELMEGGDFLDLLLENK